MAQIAELNRLKCQIGLYRNRPRKGFRGPWQPEGAVMSLHVSNMPLQVAGR